MESSAPPPSSVPRPPAPTAWAALSGGVAFIGLFVLATWLLAPRLASIPHLPDTGPGWYFWKLPEATTAGRLSAWGLYLAHQVGGWWLIALMQRAKLGTGAGLHRLNALALGFHGVFVALRLLQTHLWYDGLAQDVHIVTSLASVAVLLVWVLLMENPRRGLFFGVKAPIPRDVTAWARRYHGYYFSWAVTYTLWYHPTEATNGHLIGFGYLLLIVLQGALAFTRVHTNRWWTLLLEVLVLAHGTIVALSQGQELWTMFFFGFASVFVVTQVYGVTSSRAVRVGVALAWVAGVALVYAGQPAARWNEPFRIPLIDYPAVFVLTALVWLGLRAVRALRPSDASPSGT